MPRVTAATITIAVTPEEAERLYLAEANGTVRLTVPTPVDTESQPSEARRGRRREAAASIVG